MKTVIFGTSNLAQLLYYYATEDSGIKIDAFAVDRQYIDQAPTMPCPVVAYDELLKYSGECAVLSSVGYYDMNTRRRDVYNKLKNDGFIIADYIHPTAQVAKNAVLGEGNIILENVVIQAFSKLGNCNFMFANACIAHHSTIGSFNWFAPAATVGGEANIGDLSFFGINSTVKSKVTVRNSTLVGAGAYCSMDTVENQLIKPIKSEYLIYEAFSKF